MIDLRRDQKARIPVWTITRTDSEGYHRQLALTEDEMDELTRRWQLIRRL